MGSLAGCGVGTEKISKKIIDASRGELSCGLSMKPWRVAHFMQRSMLRR